MQSKRRLKFARILVLTVGLVARLLARQGMLLYELHSFRQTQTAITIQNYFRDGWSLLHYETPVFGAPWQVPFEFPLYQTLVYAVMKLFRTTDIDLWGRLISAVVFLLSAIALWYFSRLVTDEKVADVTVVIYLFSPYELYWSRAVLIDYTSVLLAIVYGICMCLWLRSTQRYGIYILGLLTAVMAYLQKSTTMFGFVFFLGIVIIMHYHALYKEAGQGTFIKWLSEYIRKNWFSIILLIILCVLPIVPVVFWNHYADAVKASNPYTAWLCSSSLKEWNFGTIYQRLKVDNWKVIFDRVAKLYGGGIAFAILAGGYLFNKERKYLYMELAAIGGMLFSIIIIFNLYYVHDYYLMGLTPFACISAGILFAGAREHIAKGKYSVTITMVLGILFAFCLAYNGMEYVYAAYSTGNTEFRDQKTIEDISDEDDYIIIEGMDWSPAYLYSVNRKGFMIRQESAKDIENLCENVFCKENYRFLLGADSERCGAVLAHYDMFVQYLSDTGYRLYKLLNADDPEAIEIDHMRKQHLECLEGVYTIHTSDVPYLSIECSEEILPGDIALLIVFEDGTARAVNLTFREGVNRALLSTCGMKDGAVQIQIWGENAGGYHMFALDFN